MGCNRKGTQIALVENHGMFESVQESIVKIYDVGRPRNNGEDPTTNVRVLIFNSMKGIG